ncbi:MAG TPA: CvpA family protein, partial [Aeromicrobium sp.]|nr:CvpA family protein [Aeromicrobium sp.]
MNSLDVILIAVVLAYAVSGYLQGFVVNLVATVGLLAGGLVMVAVVPLIITDRERSLGTSLLALGLVVAGAAVGQAIGTYIGTELRTGVKARPLRGLDAVGGSLLSIVAVLSAGWALGYSVSGTQIPYLAQA